MSARGFYTLFFGALMLVTSLSVGSQGAFLLGAAALLALALALISVLFSFFTCRISQQMQPGRVSRGERGVYTLTVRLFTPLPIAPLALQIQMPSGRQGEFMLPVRLFGSTVSENTFPCPHVGVFSVGAARVTLSDCFGMFSLARRVRVAPLPLTVLPVPSETEPVRCSPGEGESTAAQRAQADRTTPEDTRLWQEGDDMRRIHWKLSMRRQELMVRTYETPQRPDALILLDCSAPDAPGAQRSHMIDALTEACAGVVKSLLDEQRIVCLPLMGDAPRELRGQNPDVLAAMLEALAQERFSHQDDFTRALLLASRRMHRTGSAVILSSRLTPPIADAAIALSRMGPCIRFTLVASAAPSAGQEKLLALLRLSGVETDVIPCGNQR